jgi:hypothetical protein
VDSVTFFECGTGLPDGIFLDQKFHFGYILEGLGMEQFGMFGYFKAVWRILWIFGRFCGLLY